MDSGIVPIRDIALNPLQAAYSSGRKESNEASYQGGLEVDEHIDERCVNNSLLQWGFPN